MKHFSTFERTEPQDAPLTEPYVTPDAYISGLADIDELSDGLFRMTFYADSRTAYDGTKERLIVARHIVTRETLAAMSHAMASASMQTVSGCH